MKNRQYFDRIVGFRIVSIVGFRIVDEWWVLVLLVSVNKDGARKFINGVGQRQIFELDVSAFCFRRFRVLIL